MRRSLFYLVLLSVGWLEVSVTEARAQKDLFLKVNNPADSDRYGPGATCIVGGFLQLPEPTTNIENFVMNARFYSPSKKEFVIANDALGTFNKQEPGKNLRSFQVSLMVPMEAGTYLLRVDCIDITKRHPKNLIATQSIFIEVAKTAKPPAPLSVDINFPKAGSTFDYKSSIPVGGITDQAKVVKCPYGLRLGIQYTRILSWMLKMASGLEP